MLTSGEVGMTSRESGSGETDPSSEGSGEEDSLTAGSGETESSSPGSIEVGRNAFAARRAKSTRTRLIET